jgi:hypothetical protein
MQAIHNSPNIPPNGVKRRNSTANGETPVRGVRQDKPLQDPAPRSLPTASPSQKMTRGGLNGHKNQSFTKRSQNHAIMRPKEKLYIWVEPQEKAQLERIAESKGLSVSQTGRAIIVDGIRQELRIEREVLAVPILEAYFDKKMNVVINRISEFLARCVYEGGQVRWLFVNTLYREVLNSDKKLTKEEFYKLLDTSQKETIKSVKQWNPHIKDMVAAIKEYVREGENT